MKKFGPIFVSPIDLEDKKQLFEAVAKATGFPLEQIVDIQITKQSIDSRQKNIRFYLELIIYEKNDKKPDLRTDFGFKNIANARPIHIIGTGPAGLFAALTCLQKGYKPILFERGKNVRERRRDLAVLTKNHQLNPESNYCFGEGGAGTYSDGKLYTRSHKRGNIQEILEILCFHGAPLSILYQTHPHIGTNKLPQLIEAIRETILFYGGEIHFSSALTDLEMQRKKITGIVINGKEKIAIEKLVLATGHSARDIYHLLAQKKITLQAKAFAMGVRIEHPQNLIDQMQYHCAIRPTALPAASYSFVERFQNRGIYSFCMCPGGVIAPAMTAKNEIVINGWSPSKRNNFFANSGLVVEVNQADWSHLGTDPLTGLYFQQQLEQKCFDAGIGNFSAPAQKLVDFLKHQKSTVLPATSYIPGVFSADLHQLLPDFMSQSIAAALKQYGQKKSLYLHPESLLVALESRTSSPVRIPRNPIDLTHIEIENLYPSAEGAGYAGGIISAALDGCKVIEAISKN